MRKHLGEADTRLLEILACTFDKGMIHTITFIFFVGFIRKDISFLNLLVRIFSSQNSFNNILDPSKTILRVSRFPGHVGSERRGPQWPAAWFLCLVQPACGQPPEPDPRTRVSVSVSAGRDEEGTQVVEILELCQLQDAATDPLLHNLPLSYCAGARSLCKE